MHRAHGAARGARRPGRGRVRPVPSTTSRRCSSASTSPARPRCGPRSVWSYLGLFERRRRSTAGRQAVSRRCSRRLSSTAGLARCPRRSRSTGRGTSRWRPQSLWATLARTDRYREWWPWLRELDVDGDGLVAGSEARRGDPGAAAVPAALHRARRRGGSAQSPRGDGHRRSRRARRASSCNRPRPAPSRAAGVAARGDVGAPAPARRSWPARRSRGRTTASWNAASSSSRRTRSRSRPLGTDAVRSGQTAGAARRDVHGARSHPLGREPDALDVVDDALARLLGRGLQVLQLLDAPVLEHDGNEDVVVVRLEVVHADVGDRARVRREVGDARAGHLERAHLTVDGRDHARRVDLERGCYEVAVEDVVEVLVGGDSAHDRFARRVVEQLPGVAVRDPRRQLLERDVHDAVADAGRVGHLARGHLRHARALEFMEVDRARHREVVADHDRVTPLLGRPPTVPLGPHAVVAEVRHDRAVVVREVVLGEEVHEERAARARRDATTRRRRTARRARSRGRGSTARTRAGTTPSPWRDGGRATPRRWEPVPRGARRRSLASR